MIQSFDEFEFDANKLELRRGGRPLKADALLLRILVVLTRRPGDLITKREIVSEVWGQRAISDNSLSVSMARLRKLLGHERTGREIVVNVHGRGYRFVRPVTPRDVELGPALSAPALGRVGAPFVGRTRVLQSMREALEAAHAGTGSMCVVSGEPGIGKTRVVEMSGREAASSGLSVAWGYCREVGDTPALWPLAQLVRELLAQVPLDLQDRRVAHVLPELERLLPELSPNGAQVEQPACNNGLSPSKHRIFDAIARVLSLTAEHGPCMLILDDLHRADPATIEFLRYFVDEIAGTRLVLVATMRPGEGGGLDLDYVLGHRNTLRVSLQTLNEAEVGSYLAACLGEPKPTLARALFLKSEGNPFFMTELTRQIRDAGASDLQRLTLPHAALELIRQRVAQLDETARGALSRAAVIGRQFSLAVLQTVTGRDAHTLMLNLDLALAGGLIVADSERTASFTFSHELLRSVLYDALTPAERRVCHGLVAHALEERLMAGETLPAADLAYHFRAALPEGDARKTVQYCGRAAEDAARVYAYADGVRYLQHAREALELLESPSPRLRLRLLLSQVLHARGHASPEFQPLMRELVATARAQQQGVELSHAGLLLDPYRGFPSANGSRAVLQEALQLLPEADLGNRAAVLARLASIPPLAYDGPRGLAQLELAKQLAEASKAPLGRYNVRMAELYLTGGPTGRSRAAGFMREIEVLFRSPGLSMTNQAVLLEAYRAIAALQDGQIGAMDEALERGEQRCRQLDAELQWQFARWRALATVLVGRRTEGFEALQALQRRVSQNSSFGPELFCIYDTCVVFGAPTRLSKAAILEGLAAHPDDPPNLWALKVRTLVSASCMREARALLGTVPAANLALLPCDRDYLGTLGALARAALGLEARDYLEALVPLLSRYTEHFAANVSFWCEGSIAQLLGLTLWQLGKPSEAIDWLEKAVASSERAGLQACAAEARLDLALHRSKLP